MRAPVATLVFLIPLLGIAATTPFPADEAVPGGVAVVALPVQTRTAPRVEMDGHKIMVVSHDGQWYALAGLALDSAPGKRTLEMRAADAVSQVSFDVGPKEYATQSLTIVNPEMVNPTAAELRRIAREQKHLDKVVNGWRRTSRPGISFIWPATGPETSGFGLKRVLNGEAKNPHSGIDIGAPTGTPVRAPADAVVADVGRYYFCGKTLTLDMGEGLYSVYCHLSIIKVHPGQRVKQGQWVGKIGATGRTTGPNLHWTVRLNGVAVDPHVFLGPNAPAPKPASLSAPPKASSASSAATVPAPAAASHRE